MTGTCRTLKKNAKVTSSTTSLNQSASENCLCILLCRMNDHTKAITGLEMKHNGIWIIKTTDPSAKVELENLVPPLTPFTFLHIGDQRTMNFIPRKFDLSLPCVIDLIMEHLSLLTIIPETLEHMSIHYPVGIYLQHQQSTHSSSLPYTMRWDLKMK